MNKNAADDTMQTDANGAADAEKTFAEIERLRGGAKLFDRLKLLALVLYLPAVYLMKELSDSSSIDLDGGGIFVLIALAFGPILVSRIFAMRARSLRAKFHGFERTFKSLAVEREVAKSFAEPAFKNITYTPDKGLEKQQVKDLGLFAEFDRCYSDDRIEGEYKNLHFEFSDLDLVGEREEEDSEGKKVTVDVRLFQGPVFRFTFGKPFPGRLRIISRRMEEINYNGCSKRTVFGKTRVTSARLHGWPEISTEAQQFNDEFLAFAPDPIAAMRILKPQVIGKICAMSEEIGHPLIFLFDGNEMYAFLHTGAGTFQLSAHNAPEQQITQVDKDIALILKFLDSVEVLFPDSVE